MPVFSIKVKWGKEIFKNVEVDTDCDVEDFKAQLYALSNVPIERQKIMCLGKTLSEEWNIPLKNVRYFFSPVSAKSSFGFFFVLGLCRLTSWN